MPHGPATRPETDEPLTDAEDVYVVFENAHDTIRDEEVAAAIEDLEDEVYAEMSAGRFWSEDKINKAIDYRTELVENNRD